MKTLAVFEFRTSNGRIKAKSSEAELTEISSSIGKLYGSELLRLLTASERLSAIPVWNSIPGRKRCGRGQTVKVR